MSPLATLILLLLIPGTLGVIYLLYPEWAARRNRRPEEWPDRAVVQIELGNEKPSIEPTQHLLRQAHASGGEMWLCAHVGYERGSEQPIGRLFIETTPEAMKRAKGQAKGTFRDGAQLRSVAVEDYPPRAMALKIESGDQREPEQRRESLSS